MMAQAAHEVRVDLGFRPYPHQRAAHGLRLLYRFIVMVWHRRAGKTVFAVLELVLAALRLERERGRFGYVAPLLSQSKEIAWLYLLDFTKDIPGRVKNESELWVELPNSGGFTSRIRLYGADNPDSLRGGYFDGVVLDELADMKPRIWGEIIRPMIADRLGWVLFIGTVKGINLLSELYFGALKGRREGWHADMRRASETGVLSEEELAAARQEMSEAQYAQEFECDFSVANVNALLGLADVQAAQERAVPEKEFSFAPKVLGVDVAREGDDMSSMALRQGLVAFKPRVLRVEDTMELAAQVAQVIDAHQVDACFIDKTGIGSGTLDRLRQLGYDQVMGIDFGMKALDPQYENKRTEMWCLMADWVKGGGCLPSEPPELVVDLTAPLKTYRNDRGRVELESKRAMKTRIKRSPDVGDSLALTFAMPVAPRAERERKGTKRDGRPAWDFNPLEAA